METAFRSAGLTTAEGIRAIGPDAAYSRLIAAGHRPHFIGYYALVMGLQARPWNDCTAAEKKALRIQFDALRATAVPQAGAYDIPPEIERMLDGLGVRAREP